MTSEAFAKFKEMVDRSRTFAVSTGETLDISKILGAAVLSSAFKKMGKDSSFDCGTEMPENFKKFISAILGEEIGGGAIARENIIIKFDSKTLPVKELKYEKEGDTVKIILEGAGNAGAHALDTSNIEVIKETVPVDLLLLIDPKEGEIENILSKNPHKEVIKIGAKDKNLPLKLTDLIKALFSEIPEHFREALWFLVEEEEKINRAPSREGFFALREIWEAGLDKEKLLKAREEIFTQKFNKLLGRALSRSHFEKEISTLWSFLPQTDFQKTGAGRWAPLNILRELRALNPNSRLYALLWGEGEDAGVSAILASSDKELLGRLASSFSTSLASSYFMINSFENFSEAEIKIRNSIRQAILQ